MKQFQLKGKSFQATQCVLGACLLAGLTACGGGGSNARPSPPPASVVTPTPPAPVPPPVVSTPNPAFSKHLAVSNAYPALEAGLTGQGYAIGVVDTGVNRNHPALQGRVTHNLNYVNSPPNNLAVDDVVGHGTAVSLIAAGKAFGAWPGGVAPGATIISARIINDARPSDDGSGQGNEVSGAIGLGPINQDLINRGARIMNNSWGGLYWTNPAATAAIAQEYRPFITSNDGLVVFATGNSSFANPSSMAALPSQLGTGGSRPAADLERGWLTVAALNTDNPTQLASYSNACGVAMNYCLAAAGSVVAPGTNDSPSSPSYWTWTGTSLATPLISGAAALVWQAFPYFNNDLVRQTVLGTANDLGAPGVDPVFGYGALDIGRAVRGPAQFNWGDVNVNFASVTSTWGNAISGSGGLIKRGTGTLSLTGANSYSGASRVQGGTLAFTATAPSNTFAETAGTVVLRGGVNGTLDNRGRVNVLGAAGSRSITGNYVQTANAVLGYQVGSPLSVNGSAQLAGQLQVLGIASGYVRSSSETVLTAAGGVSGTFASLSNGPGVFLEGTLGYDPNRVRLDITRLDITAAAMLMGVAAPASLDAATRLEAAFDRIDEQLGGPLAVSPTPQSFLALAGEFQRTGSVADASASLHSLSGQVHAAADHMTFNAIDLQRRALSARFGQLIEQPRAAGDWFQTLGQAGGAAAAGNFELDGWLLGTDQRLGQQAVVGLAFGETRASNTSNPLGDLSRDRQTQAQFYAGAMRGQAYALGQLGLGHYDRQVRRAVQLGAERYGVASDYSGEYTLASVETGYRFGGAGWSLTPYVGINHARVSRGGFSETGASGFGLQTRDSRGERSQAVAGARSELAWAGDSGQVWALNGYVEWQELLAARGFAFDASFVGVDAWTPLGNEAAAGSGGVFGLGLETRPADALSLGLGYDRRFGAYSRDSMLSLRAALRF